MTILSSQVIDAIATQKERSGSSLSAIKNHLGSKYKVDVAKKAGTLNRLQYHLLNLCSSVYVPVTVC